MNSFNCNSFKELKILVFFSPRGGIENFLLNVINNAKYELLMVAYHLTNKHIVNAIIKAYNRGVKVKIILDSLNYKKNKIFKKLINHNILVKLNYSYKIMHNKFLIIDNNSIQTGSYNYTISAEKYNSENIIFLKCFLKVVKQYKKKFLKLWNESTEINV